MSSTPQTISFVIPVYRNEAFLPELQRTVEHIASQLDDALEVVFVIDGSPDNCEAWLAQHLPEFKVPAQLLALSRNFGSFTAVRMGLAAARGEVISVMAADLQEPPELIVDFFRRLNTDAADIAIGTRSRQVMRLAGEHADIALVGARYLTPPLVAQYRQWLAEGAATAGRAVEAIEVTGSGVTGDRTVALVDAATGRIASAMARK